MEVENSDNIKSETTVSLEKRAGSGQQKQSALFRLLVIAGIIVLLNILGSRLFVRLDLTSDHRFSISDSTKSMLRNLKDHVFVKIFLAGDMPPGFRRLSNSTRDLLDEMKIYAGENLQYEFEDPLAGKTEKEQNEILQELYDNGSGLEPTNVQIKTEDDYSQKLLIPGALITYGSHKSIPVNLLNNESGLNSQLALNNSEAQLEYKFSSTIKSQITPLKSRIAFLSGQGETGLEYLYDFVKTISVFYQTDSLSLKYVVDVKKKTDVLVIARPTQPFSEEEKFKLDQFVMNGGKILWLLDAMNASLDSLMQKPAMLALNYDLQLEDLLFNYGIRLNNDLLMDIVCNPVPLSVSKSSDGKPQFKPFPCPYFPVLIPEPVHPINYSADAVKTTFAGTLDTVVAKGIRKTILLHSSNEAKRVFAPWLVDFRELHKRPDESSFTKKNLPVAVLLEGNFNSLYKNRVPDNMLTLLRDSLKTPFKESSTKNSMIVISDGDFASNEYGKGGVPLSLGYYRYSYSDVKTPVFFDNKKFLLNCLDYLTNNLNNIETRGKQVKLQLLDTQKVKAEKTKWQLLNIGIPILFFILFGVMYAIVRVRKYSRL